MRIKKNINLGIISSTNTQFSALTLYELVESKENYKFDLGVKGLRYLLNIFTLNKHVFCAIKLENIFKKED